MKIIKFLKIASLSAITSLSVSIGVAHESDPSDFDLMQVAEAYGLDHHEQQILLETINQWDDYTYDYLDDDRGPVDYLFEMIVEKNAEQLFDKYVDPLLERGAEKLDDYFERRTEERERDERAMDFRASEYVEYERFKDEA